MHLEKEKTKFCHGQVIISVSLYLNTQYPEQQNIKIILEIRGKTMTLMLIIQDAHADSKLDSKYIYIAVTMYYLF